ncbi:hypothetical protein CR513_62810, partial [Mucuna pruriens]
MDRNNNIDYDELDKEKMLNNGKLQDGAIILLCCVGHALHLLNLLTRKIHTLCIDFAVEREQRHWELMTYLRCCDIICMSLVAFILLSQKLRNAGIVKDNIQSTMDEQVTKFLHIIGHNVNNRTLSFFSIDLMRLVLYAIIALEVEFVIQPSVRVILPQILNNSRFYPFFRVSFDIHLIYYVSLLKKSLSNMVNLFLYKGLSWSHRWYPYSSEGPKGRSPLISWKKRLSNTKFCIQNFFYVGKYYLKDVGVMLKHQILTLNEGVHYHLKEYSVREPQNYRELFNLHHLSL